MGRAVYEPLLEQTGLAANTRHHYIAGMMIAATIGVVLAGLMPAGRPPRWFANVALAASIVALALASHWDPPISHYDFARRETAHVLDEIARQTATAPAGADVYIANKQFNSVWILLRNDLGIFPGWAAVFAMFHPDDTLAGHRAYFLAAPEDLAGAQRQGGRQVDALLRPIPTPTRSSDDSTPTGGAS
jgi:hypothetical protein